MNSSFCIMIFSAVSFGMGSILVNPKLSTNIFNSIGKEMLDFIASYHPLR